MFLDAIIKIQTTTYIKIRNINETALLSKLGRKQSYYLMDFYEKYGNCEVCPHGEQKEIAQMGKNLTLKCLPRISNFAQMG
jgi:Cys-tRNA synthase (O-phospho-L-seryl-tRNA:Cys-tRNA synthase)